MPTVMPCAVMGAVILALSLLLLWSLRRSRRVADANRRFSLTLSSAYEQVYELNLTGNEFNQYFILNGLLEKTKMHEPLGVYLPRVIREHVYQRDAAQVGEFLSMEKLRRLSDESRTVYTEYRRLSPQGTPYWCSLLAQGLAKKGRQPASVMLYICDIDAIKSKEHRARQRLREALKNAEHLSEVKSNFTRRISHEIRTPLNAIMGYLAIARAHASEPERMTDCLEKADFASRHLMSVVSDILDMSAIESGKMRLDKHPFKLRDFVGSLGTLYYEQAKEEGLDFEIRLEAITEENLIGDAVRLRQILMNLLSNAFKFTPAGRRVRLLVRQKAIVDDTAHLEFVVNDNGEGMSEAFMARIFDAYEQEEGGSARRHGGSGLGLSIVKNLVEIMGGSVEVQSVYGEGSTFTVNLPVRSAPCELPGGALRRAISRLRVLSATSGRGALELAGSVASRLGVRMDTAISGYVAAEKAEQAGAEYDLVLLDWDIREEERTECLRRIRAALGEDVRVAALAGTAALMLLAQADSLGLWRIVQKPLNHSVLMDLLSDAARAVEDADDGPRGTPDLGGNRVLLVEDNLMNREIGRELLKNANIDVDVAENGEEAVLKFVQQEPGTYQLILMDLQMPVMDGFTATRKIRACGRADGKEIPIVALTANAYPSDVNQSLAAGMNAHAAKPIDPDALYALMQKYME